MMRDHPIAVQLRFLQTMSEVSEEQNASFGLIPFPMEMLEAFRTMARRSGGSSGEAPAAHQEGP